MRLTLRTLLAWLDDTLSPSQVREIGHLVSDSQFARDLVDRTHRVTRQRRLTVPTGPEAADPNMVAAYIDNTLPPDQVTEYERVCLTSDVHLAEAASVHQILSLLGHKAKVPPEARHRMYRLIKGREAIANLTVRKPQTPPVVVTHPPSSAAPERRAFIPEPTPRPNPLVKYGPVAGVAALIAIFSLAAWNSLFSSRQPSQTIAKNQQVALAPPKDVAEPKPIVPVAPAAVAKVEVPAEPAPEPEPVAAVEANQLISLPAGAIGGLALSPGVMLRADDETKEWGRMKEGDAFKADERIVNLDPFRDTLQMGKSRVEVVGAAEFVPLANTPDHKGRFKLDRGRLIVSPLADGATLALGEADGDVLFAPESGVRLGIERTYEAGKPGLDLLLADASATVTVGEMTHEIQGPGVFEFVGTEAPTKTDDPLPAWFTAEEPSAFAKGIGDKFLAYFKEGRPTINVLTEAMDDPEEDVRRVAIATLGVLGEWSLMVPALDKPDDPLARETAIEVVRRRLQDAGPGAELLQAEIMKVFGDEVGEVVLKLLLGYSEAESKAETTFTQLVADLKDPQLAVRQLALENLIQLTGRDSMEYDPDKPEGMGLKNWQDWLAQRKAAGGNRR